MLTYDTMIPSNVNKENKVLQLVIALRYKKEKISLLIEESVPSGFGLNNAEIKKMTKY